MTRADQELVARGLVDTRSRAADLIKSKQVFKNGQAVAKPSTKIAPGDVLELRQETPQFASRAGLKLYSALAAIPDIGIEGATCLDAGASTGGFTDVLLQAGAKTVYAVDVGHDQIIDRLRHDERVVVREGLNIRHLTHQDVEGHVDIVVSDLSFISLTLVVEPLVDVLVDGGHILMMVKPQFEVGKSALPKSGVVTDPEQRRDAVTRVLQAGIDQGLTPLGLKASEVVGQNGNKEFFIWATKSAAEAAGQGATGFALDSWVDEQRVDWADTPR